jgi:hypothetical protein
MRLSSESSEDLQILRLALIMPKHLVLAWSTSKASARSWRITMRDHLRNSCTILFRSHCCLSIFAVRRSHSSLNLRPRVVGCFGGGRESLLHAYLVGSFSCAHLFLPSSCAAYQSAPTICCHMALCVPAVHVTQQVGSSQLCSHCPVLH